MALRNQSKPKKMSRGKAAKYAGNIGSCSRRWAAIRALKEIFQVYSILLCQKKKKELGQQENN